MARGLWDKLRGARRIELFAALALAALLALMLINASGGGDARRTALEARVERVLSRVEGAGRISAMITEDDDGRATGALIVAEDLEDVGVCLRLQRSVAALLELDLSRIEIIGKTDVWGGSL